MTDKLQEVLVGSSDALLPWPPPLLVNSVARALHRSAGGPGFAVLRGFAERVGPDVAQACQVSLMWAVWQEMSRHGWVTGTPEEVRLNLFEAEDGRLPVEIVGDTVTFKRLHFDPHSIIFGHLYYPTQNVRGGDILLVDVRAYLNDTRVPFEKVFHRLERPGDESRLVTSDQHGSQLRRAYTTRVSPPKPGETLLLIVRNSYDEGVAHEIADVHAIREDRPTSRRFLRTSIARHH